MLTTHNTECCILTRTQQIKSVRNHSNSVGDVRDRRGNPPMEDQGGNRLHLAVELHQSLKTGLGSKVARIRSKSGRTPREISNEKKFEKEKLF